LIIKLGYKLNSQKYNQAVMGWTIDFIPKVFVRQGGYECPKPKACTESCPEHR
ncbi:MAG: hypothetical protein ACI8P3_002821, partial [Saprospiraceae bacterium]